MELLPYLTDLSVGKSKALLECTFTVMFSQSVFVALIVVLDSYSFQMSLFKYAIFNAVLSIESANAFQQSTYMFPYT